jgi:hypothetical protein
VIDPRVVLIVGPRHEEQFLHATPLEVSEGLIGTATIERVDGIHYGNVDPARGVAPGRGLHRVAVENVPTLYLESATAEAGIEDRRQELGYVRNAVRSEQHCAWCREGGQCRMDGETMLLALVGPRHQRDPGVPPLELDQGVPGGLPRACRIHGLGTSNHRVPPPNARRPSRRLQARREADLPLGGGGYARVGTSLPRAICREYWVLRRAGGRRPEAQTAGDHSCGEALRAAV